MTDIILLLVVLGAVNHQIAHIVTEGVLFDGCRARVRKIFGANSKITYLFTCHLCFGTWVGLFQGCIFVTFGGHLLGVYSVIDAVFIGLATACVGRLWNEVLALLSAKVAYTRAQHVREEQHIWVDQTVASRSSK